MSGKGKLCSVRNSDKIGFSTNKKRARIEIQPSFNPIFYEKPIVRYIFFNKGCSVRIIFFKIPAGFLKSGVETGRKLPFAQARFAISLMNMLEEDEFFIQYKGVQVKVSTILSGAKIFFSIHLQPPFTIAEGVVGEDFVWYDIHRGPTPVAAEIGEIIEAMEL